MSGQVCCRRRKQTTARGKVCCMYRRDEANCVIVFIDLIEVSLIKTMPGSGVRSY